MGQAVREMVENGRLPTQHAHERVGVGELGMVGAGRGAGQGLRQRLVHDPRRRRRDGRRPALCLAASDAGTGDHAIPASLQRS